MSIKIVELAKKYRIEDTQEVDLIKRALNQNNDSLIQNIFVPKKWRQFKAEYQQIKSQPTVYFRYPFKPMPPANSQSKSVKCITIGPCGSGKTTTINQLCGTNLIAGSSSSSLTRDVVQVESLEKYPTPFVFYDTPGTTAHQEKLMHATFVRQLLQHSPINCVIILMKYENRTDEFIMNIFRQVNMLPNYEGNILFLITHFDLASKSPEQEIATVEGLMKKMLPKFTNQMIFFSNQTVDPRELSDTLYSIARSFNKVKIKIDETTFFKFYNIEKSKSEELFFKDSQKQITKEMEEAADDYIEYAISLPDNNERDAILQDIQVQLKNELLGLLEGYVQNYRTAILSYEYYESYYTLQLTKNDNLTRYQDKIRSLQKFSYFQSACSGSKLDIRDLIKKCPNPQCGLIWFRIQSCPNTSCGSRPSCIFDYIKKPVSRFRIFRNKKTKKVVVQKAQTVVNEKAKGLNENTLSDNLSIKQRMSKGKALGCGQAMNFESLPRLENIQKLLIEWYGTHTIEEVIKMFQADEDLQRTRRQVERKARQSFYLFKFLD